MNWILVLEIGYIIIMLLVILRVLYDTRSGSKALAYILFIVMIPVLGILFYFWFGVNYRKRKLYSKKIDQDKKLREELRSRMYAYSARILNSGLIPIKHRNLVEFIRKSSSSPLTANNVVKLLLNGEEKFPELLNALEAAHSHIHLEYYIYENDETGNAIANMLIKKAVEGVEVRFLYDDFGSHGLGAEFLKKLEDAGVQTAPFYKIKWYALASRLNYRNHRKIIIIDGKTSFIGGINISDKYRNDTKGENGLYWRDTHLMINGIATLYLQYLFLCDWNFCSENKLEYDENYFPPPIKDDLIQQKLVQIVPSGPDSTLPVIFYSLMQAIGSAKERILITSPYFIPGESLMDALIIAAKSGVEVILLVPGISDSKMVDAAARSYYTELLQHGVRIFLYAKGFVHAKTMVIDRELSIIGSANMDYRSFDLNFEVNAMLYSPDLTSELYQAFIKDLENSSEINANDWLNRPKYKDLWERAVRLLSPFL
ncbi:Major cardiolipin synthase ClsA [Arenibacter antarcticus]|uniref:Cardiolipin synthase n=1 Tax=Arenibacter antarcticus TaxID=2040469 RepID=A0ABW5VGU5_9FLAO|nr:cardiolipin synthase [Arenibacter sp. H213]MCM4166333.1 cardiolipin synthase [Arenibacter sp. H213]